MPSELSRRRFIAGVAAAGAFPASKLARAGDQSRFDVAGNQLRFGGRPIRLLGVGVGDPVYVRGERPIGDYEVLARDWRSTAVRISVHPGHWRHDRQHTLAVLERDVTAARAAGLFVIIDWHVIGFPGRYAEPVDPSWGLPLDAFASDDVLALDFWRRVSARFGKDPGVLFELWNEPVYDGKLWRSTGEHWPVLKALWVRLINEIRSRSDAILIVAGGRWAHDLKGVAKDLIDDERVIYSWHCYPNEDRGVASRWPDSLDGLPAVKPVVVTEWGFSRDGDGVIRGTPEDFGIPFTRDILEPLKLHSMAWCFSSGATPRMLAPDGVSTTEYGAFVKDYLARSWRPET
ncbi:glycoside hydrolase family 5 protein [Hyphomicrobium sp. ghe19]|uniref:glycoside hydrolase family 5 protein n=1 Tax=Hyphomicrobium sp. ghe19 TaxID=2682968 RepID=UPI0013671255|nr:Endoglucanase 4 [Hyphomicrobium sp. ghe19]